MKWVRAHTRAHALPGHLHQPEVADDAMSWSWPGRRLRFGAEPLLDLAAGAHGIRMSMRSLMISPPMSRRRSCRQISSTASQFVLVGVGLAVPGAAAAAELTSIATRASV